MQSSESIWPKEFWARFWSTVPATAGLIAVLLPRAALPAAAQQRPQVQAGQRVRISFDCSDPATVLPGDEQLVCADDGRETGTLVRLLSDSLVLETSGSTVAYPLSSVALLEASRGSTSRWKAGALIGFLGGTALTFAVLKSGSPASTNFCDPAHNQDAIGGSGTCLLVAGVIGGLPGGLVGVIIGSRVRTERWEEVSFGAVGLTFLPLGPRPTLTVSVPLGLL